VTIVHGVDHVSATLRSQSARVLIYTNIPNVCSRLSPDHVGCFSRH
jgi:hypothetical protein